MTWLARSLSWIYGFLAEDVILLFGTALAFLVALVAGRLAPQAAGAILFFTVLVVITVSLYRASSSPASAEPQSEPLPTADAGRNR